jgi:hypothetical protein
MTACAINLNVTISFGGRTWPINNADISFLSPSPGVCIGGIFDLGSSLGSNGPDWVIGSPFLVCGLVFDHQSAIRLDLILSVDVEKCLRCLSCDAAVHWVRAAVSRGRGYRYAYFLISHST